jgi:hypothetical protein
MVTGFEPGGLFLQPTEEIIPMDLRPEFLAF